MKKNSTDDIEKTIYRIAGFLAGHKFGRYEPQKVYH